jgi:M6 family metalloprotease-like protein
LVFLAGALALMWSVRRPEVGPAGARSDATRGATDHFGPDLEISPPDSQEKLAAAERRSALEQLAYAQAWDDPALPAGMAAFRAWSDRYRRAAAVDRPGLMAEGVALALARRAEMSDLIALDPRRALAVTVPAVVRRELPPEVLAQLESRVAGRGDLALVASLPAPGEPAPVPMRRRALVGGVSYTAFVYGRREPLITQAGVSLHGIALDRRLAVHESPVRALEPGEGVAGAVAAESCPVSALPVPAVAADATVNVGALNFAEAEGRVLEFCSASPHMVETYAQRLEAAEANSGAATAGTPGRAAEPASSWTLGTKQVLVIRVDFSDVPGEPITQAAALNVMNNGVRPYFEDVSYGQTSISATVSDTVYRMPQTGNAYARDDNEDQMHADARAAAGANYTVSSYDRVIVVFPNIGTSRFSDSKITFGGEALVNAANVWINGSASFTMATVSHELGHTYGLLHANLWRINDGNPISTNGTSLEYGDPFDVMGSTSVTGVTRDTRHHFSPWHKNRLGWLPDSAVTTVTTSGTYRIYRFDSRDAPRTQAQALRIFRDGVRWYWVGLRQNFATGSPQANDAYVTWGFNNRQQSQLLDLTTPGSSANDASLKLGVTFSDPVSGVSIKPIARGGSDPVQYLDIEVTVPGTVANGVMAWGREGATFFDGNTGALASPAPETYVPFGLTAVAALAGGDRHMVALKHDGTVVAWGNHLSGQINVPSGLGEVVSVAAGGDVSGVVKRDGTVQLWGSTSSGLTTPPAGLANVVDLKIGRNHALALKSDGTVVAWGVNAFNQTTVPAGLANVTAIAAGAEASIALKRDGTVTVWGRSFGAVPAGLSGVTAVSAFGALTGGQYFVALKSDGTVVAWGANNANQTNVPAGLSGVVAIAASGFQTLALKSDGTIVYWGGTTTPPVPRSMPRARAIAASSAGAFALIGSGIAIIAQPQDQTVVAGANVTLRVTASSGSGGLSYQWRKDGVAITGATASTLALMGVTVAVSGLYDVVVRDAQGSLTSNAGRLTVNAVVPQEVSRIANLSIRTRAGTGAQTLIVGFVVGGAGTVGTKPLLVRGVGPTLGVFGVTGALADPLVAIYSSTSVKLYENDNWIPTDADIFASVGAFPLNANSRDAALYNGALPSAAYSAQLSGVGGATGIALAELYDVTPAATFGPATPRLINVSARALSGTGADVLIAGFVIAGPGSKNVLIRAIGPTLSVFGVTGVLADPKLELFNVATVKLQENDNWATPVGTATPVTAATFTSVGAFSLAVTSRDAALLATLPPGAYTAQISGVGGTTGVALVEVYEAP